MITLLDELKEIKRYSEEEDGVDEFTAQTFMNDHLNELVTTLEMYETLTAERALKGDSDK